MMHIGNRSGDALSLLAKKLAVAARNPVIDDITTAIRLAESFMFEEKPIVYKELAMCLEMKEFNEFKKTETWRKGKGLPHGDGRKVALLQGFCETRNMPQMEALGEWLVRMGWSPDFVGPKWNGYSIVHTLNQVNRDMSGIVNANEGPVVAIGRSLGGTQLFLLSQSNPKWFKGLITLDSPINPEFTFAEEVAMIGIPIRLANGIALGVHKAQKAAAGNTHVHEPLTLLNASKAIGSGILSCVHEELIAVRRLSEPAKIPIIAYRGKGGIVARSSAVRPDAMLIVETGATHMGHSIKPSVLTSLARDVHRLYNSNDVKGAV